MTMIDSASMTASPRLNRYIAMCGICSRREADRLIDDGRVLVNGKPAVNGMHVNEGDLVSVDGREIHPEEREIVLALYKPAGVVCSAGGHPGDRLIGDMACVRAYPERLFYMGRLDKDSEGLLLMTNQGKLSDAIMRSRNKHEKEYVVRVDRPITEVFLQKMAQGVYLEELQVTTKPCRIWKTDRDTFHIVLTQGLNRQIRRMCITLGYQVRTLKRIRIMNILLGDLKSGESRELTVEELAELRRRA